VELIAIVLGALGMVALGCWDDKHELRPARNSAANVNRSPGRGGGSAHHLVRAQRAFQLRHHRALDTDRDQRVDFMDNMDGLCAGLGAIGAGCFALIAAAAGNTGRVDRAVGAGALLGFLPFNFPQASAFLGGRRQPSGRLSARRAVDPSPLLLAENPEAFAVFKPLLVLAVPLVDLVWVVILRWRLGRPFYVGDNNHLSHRLVRRGWSRPGAVLFILAPGRPEWRAGADLVLLFAAGIPGAPATILAVAKPALRPSQ